MPNPDDGKEFRESQPSFERQVGTSIGTKLAIATVGVLLVASIALYGQLTRRERQSLVASKRAAADMVADLFAASLAAPLDFGDADAVHGEIANLEKNPEVLCAVVFAKDDTVLGRLDRGCEAPASGGEADRVEVARAVTGVSGAEVGRARVVFSLARENAAFEESRRRIFLLSLALAIGTTAVLLAIARRQIVLPLARLTVAARRVGRGELGARVELSSNDEMGVLATTFNRMSVALRDREERLEAATQSLRELFDHMRQGILAFDRDGVVRGEVSKEARRFFRGDVEGKRVSELLFGEDPYEVDAQAFEEFRALAFDIPLERWAELAELAPRDVRVVRDDDVLSLELEFQPIVRGRAVELVMMLATDVSAHRRLEQAAREQEEVHARKLASMRRLVAGGANLFVGFTESARDHIAACLALLGPAPRPLPRGELDVLFRRVHTLKGEARSFDLHDLEKELGELEGRLRTLRSATDAGEVAEIALNHAALVSGLKAADDLVLRAREDFVSVSPTGRAALDQVTVQRTDVEELQAAVRGNDDRIARLVERLAARRFGESVTTLVDQVPIWAAREGKQVELAVDGRDVRVPPSLARVLSGVLAHLVRNAIAHGVETPLERTRQGKEPIGIVCVLAKDAPGGPLVVVEDDGAGLDAARIEARARELGLDADAPAAELVFSPGLSTRDRPDELGGLGVGLDAVKGDLAACGYDVRVESAAGLGTRFILSPRA